MDTKKFIENWVAKFQAIQMDFALSINKWQNKSVTVYVRGFDDETLSIWITFYQVDGEIYKNFDIYSFRSEESIADEYERALSYAKEFVK